MSPSSSLLPTRRLASGLILLLTAAFLPGALALAEEGKPAKKDSRPAAQPKEVTFTAKVVPARAKPGDKVKLQVTAKLDFNWHIFKYARTQAEDGPRLTTFDFYQTAGLKPLGDWTPSAEPIRKKEPAFPDIPFLEFHEDEITWTLDLQVPADADPGKRILKVQAGYQICSDQSCSFPGQWTVPPAELTVTQGRGLSPQAAAFYSLYTVGFQAPEAAKPKKKDSRPASRPKTATFTTAIVPADAKPGDTVSLQVAAKLDPGHHIFPNVKNEPEETGPTNTVFDLFDTSGLVVAGEWKSEKPPIEGKIGGLPGITKFYEGEVVWTIPLKVPTDATSGKKSIQVQARYQICDDKTCSFPGQWTLPAATLNLAGTAVAEAETPKLEAVPDKPAPQPEKTATVAPAPVEKKADAPAAPLSEVEKQAQQSIWGFLLVCAGGGLLALVMPCVWPMVPITVNFFVKQGQSQKGGTTGLAVAYCVSIIGIFTLVGLLFSIFFGASSLAKLANNPWLNFGVAGLFIVFGLSLLGLFEIGLPNFLLNASAQGESRGGIVGVMFMALTLTITSFTCTFPVVGGLLVMAAGGSYLYPTIGLATFAAVIAAPFFLLALAPGLLSKMPKSGDWMNAVKMVGGLVEIGAAFKFLNTAEVAFVVPEDAIFNAEVILAIWVILALVCGIYLLGLFKTDHDHGDVKVGPGRILVGMLFLCLALYLAPALFGNPPKGVVYNRLIIGILPADAGRLNAFANLGGGGGGGAGGGGGGEALATKATSSDPAEAERQQISFHGVAWGFSYEKALEEAKKQNKPVLIDFTGVNCANCRLMEQHVLNKSEVVTELKKFVTVQLYTDFVPIPSISRDQRAERAEKNVDLLLSLKVEPANPSYVVLTPEGKVVAMTGGYREVGVFVDFLKKALTSVGSPAKAEMAAVEPK